MIDKGKCFTLIEMLVTISILLILITLLQPSLAKIFESANALQCQNNLSHFAKAIAIYHDDYDGFYPTIRNHATLSGKKGKVAIYGGLVNYESRTLNPYLDSEEVSHCPSDKGDVVFNATKFSDLCYDDYGTSYLPAAYYNRGGVVYLFGRNAKNPSKNINQLDRLQNKFVVSDWTWGTARDYRDEENRWHGGIDSRNLNILFADGHVSLTEFTNAYELTKITRRPDKNWLFW